MRIGVFAYPSTLLEFGGGLVTLTKTYEYLRDSGRSVVRFDPWSHRLADIDLLHHFGFAYCNYEWFRTLKVSNVRIAVTPMYWVAERPRYLRPARKVLSRFGWLKSPPVLVRLMLQMADLVLPNSPGEQRLLSELYGCPDEKMRIVPCGVDDRFSSADPGLFEQEYGVSDYLLCVGRFDPSQKNQLGLVRALKNTGIQIVFIGGASTGREAYYELCRREAPEGTLFLDFLDPNGPLLPSAFAAANTLVVPSLFEYPCMVAMEALLAGTKVAITTGGTTTEYFRDYVTYLDPCSESSIRHAVLESYGKELDPRAQDFARKHFLWDHVGQCLESAYASAGFA